MHAVAKPALLRSLFGLAATHPSQILSWNKMLGQLVIGSGGIPLEEFFAAPAETWFG